LKRNSSRSRSQRVPLQTRRLEKECDDVGDGFDGEKSKESGEVHVLEEEGDKVGEV
jgi:hypothetical protein